MANSNKPVNKAKYEPKKLTQKELEAKEAKREKIVKLSIQIFAIVALVAIVAGIVIGIVVSINKDDTGFNYLEENLNKYVSVDLDKIRDFAVKNNVDPVTDAAVRNEILKLLNTHKPDDALGNGKRYNNKPVAPGDDAYIFYRGYTKDEDGNKIDFAGGSNLLPTTSSEIYEKSFATYKDSISALTIGSDSFISGFELAIVDAFYSENGVYNGKLPLNDYQQYLGYEEVEKTTAGEGDYITIKFTKRNVTDAVNDPKVTIVTINLADPELDATYGLTNFASYFVDKAKNEDLGNISGATLDGKSIEYQNVSITKVFNTTKSTDLVQVSYSTIGSSQATTIVVDLSNTNLDKTYGAGFRAFLTGKPVGTSLGEFIAKIEGKDTDELYTKVTVEKVLRFSEDKEPLTISVKFPYDYGNTELAGKQAYFDVYVFGVKKYYDVDADGFPTLDDDFITNELKLTAEDLAGYAGDTLAKQYEAKIRAELEATYAENVNELIETTFWEVLNSAATIKKYPESEIEYYFSMYYYQLYEQYSMYQQYYGSAYTFDMFVEAQGIADKNTTWEQALTKRAEQTVKEKLSFYYVVKAEQLLPSDSELDALCEEFRAEKFEEFLTQNNYDPATDENQTMYNGYKDEFNAQYTDAAVIESVQFEYAMEKLYGYANVTVG